MLPSADFRVFRYIIVTVLALFCCGSLFAQNTVPRLTGVVIDSPIAEGSYANLRARIVDPDAGNRFVLTVNWGDNTTIDRINYPAGTTNFSIFHLYSDNNSSNTYRVAITIADNAGGSRNTNKFVTVTNVAPVATDITITPAIDEHAPATLRGTQIQEFQVPTTNAIVNTIVAGPDGALWFTETLGQKIGRITTNGVVTEYPVSLGTNLQGITVGPDGALWFCIEGRSRIGRITTNGVITQYPLTAGRFPLNISTGPDGALWITLFFGDARLARMTTNGTVTENVLQPGATPYSIVTGPDGHLWYTDYYFDWVVRSTTANDRTNWARPYLASPAIITVGPDQALWFTESGGDTQPGGIVRITTNGVIAEFPLGTNVGPHGITTGPDGAMWFTESASNRIGRLSLDGKVTRFPVAPGNPSSIITGPDGALWFTESGRNRIGRLGFTTVGNVLLSGTFGDPGFGDGHTLTINWGDGTAPQVVTFPAGIVSFNVAHHYTNSGPSYPVSVTVADDDSTQSATNLTVAVVRSRLTSIQRQTNGSLTLQATVVPAATYAVQASPDFQAWTTLGNSTADNSGALQFQDPTAGVPTNRFFRLLRL